MLSEESKINKKDALQKITNSKRFTFLDHAAEKKNDAERKE